MFHRILVPLDTSTFAERAVDRAAAIAEQAGAALDLVIVHEFPAMVPESSANIDAAWESEVEEYRATCMMPEAGNIARNRGITVETFRLDGAVVPALVGHIASRHVDLVVMTSHGRTGWGRAWLGSVADGLIRQSGIPVLVLRRGKTARVDGDGRVAFRKILVPLDGSSEAEQILDDVVSLAGGSAATVILARVVEPVPVGGGIAALPELVTASLPDFGATTARIDAADAYLSDTVQALHRRGVEAVESCVRVSAHVGPALVELVRLYQPDLVAMTSHGRGATRLMAGSVADNLLRGSSCALLFRRQHEMAPGADMPRLAAAGAIAEG